MKKFLVSSISLLGLLCLTLFIGSSNHTFAKGGELTPSDYSEIKIHMEKDGASEEDISNVIKKLKEGKTLDSEKAMVTEKPKAFFSNAQISKSQDSENDSFSITDENPEKTFRFEDGSYIKLGLKIEDTNLEKYSQPLQINTLSSSGIFKTVTVKDSSIFGWASYRAKIYLDTRYNDYIDDVYSPNIHTLTGTFADERLTINRKYEIRSQNITAKAYLYFKFTNAQNMSAKTTYLKVHAGDKINDRYGIWVSFTDGSAKYY
ncbi:hypothetical protein EV207_14020 [Scopulibacillus darangshiensis]|uniref:Uncharacterized protein n=1 Tax=Scopulibacillus darangshiensis TaxID=442528 RepID=A0A4R2NJU1_9BACL|nr:hypothetical protein [Scopulibacillus darangshiensis]TCP21711.1 hypothetical protein EV207_14020 [Scopulibacillus darangshiensis]